MSLADAIFNIIFGECRLFPFTIPHDERKNFTCKTRADFILEVTSTSV